jgi:osmotically-inducible protein OsmY
MLLIDTARQARRSSAPGSDTVTWRAVFDRLAASEFAGQLGAIRFEVRDGVVLLQGEAVHREDLPRLLAVVWSVPGVADVRDRLTFCGETPGELREPRCSQARAHPGL